MAVWFIREWINNRSYRELGPQICFVITGVPEKSIIDSEILDAAGYWKSNSIVQYEICKVDGHTYRDGVGDLQLLSASEKEKIKKMLGSERNIKYCDLMKKVKEPILDPDLPELGYENKPSPSSTLAPSASPYAYLQALRNEALDTTGSYQRGKAWETFATALFSLIQAFSIYPDVHTDTEQLDVILAINGDRPGGTYWLQYAPVILVECKNLEGATPQSVVSELVGKASLYNIHLVFVMTTHGTTSAAEQQARYSGAKGEILIVMIDDVEINQLLDQQGDLDAFLRRKIINAHLRQT